MAIAESASGAAPLCGPMKTFIQQQGKALGFDLVGIAAAGPQQDAPRFDAWLALGHAGSMAYLARQPERRKDVRNLLPAARSVIVCGMNYHTGPRYTEAARRARSSGWVSAYAWGDDYHDVVTERLAELLRRIEARSQAPVEARIYVDTGAVLERSYGRDAGLGWVGKNTCLINQRIGSRFFIGEIIINLDIEPDRADTDHCGSCRRCLEACPTDAFPESYVLDARKCISYLTIELRQSIPAPLRAAMGNHIFGCDICQDVCPWNRKTPTSDEPAFAARAQFSQSPLAKTAAWSAEEFRTAARRSAVKRAKYTGFLRNVAVAIGNSGDSSLRSALDRMPADDPIVAEHVAWARRRLSEDFSARAMQTPA